MSMAIKPSAARSMPRAIEPTENLSASQSAGSQQTGAELSAIEPPANHLQAFRGEIATANPVLRKPPAKGLANHERARRLDQEQRLQGSPGESRISDSWNKFWEEHFKPNTFAANMDVSGKGK